MSETKPMFKPVAILATTPQATKKPKVLSAIIVTSTTVENCGAST